MAASLITRIDQASVHRICSGQVIFDLATAVKELVENAIDAGATNLEIRVREHGTAFVEVCDNGSGIAPENYQTATLRHYTSKIRAFLDLESVLSYGFRGEALNSLCSVANVTITTRTESQEVGMLLRYDHEGAILEKRPVAHNVGTTVHFSSLFQHLPVRLQEFTRNQKKEYSHLQEVLQAYALIRSDIRFSISHIDKQGKKRIVLSTTGNGSMQAALSVIFGSKILSSLEEVKQDDNLDAAEGETIDRLPCIVTGFLSRLDTTSTLSTSSQQYLFVNRRPVDLPKLVRIANQLFRQNKSGRVFPAFFLNIQLPSLQRNKLYLETVDVNVQPDKRQVLFTQEQRIFTYFQNVLERKWTADVRHLGETSLMHQSTLSLSSMTTSTPEMHVNGNKMDKTSQSDALEVVSSPFKGTLRKSLRKFSHGASGLEMVTNEVVKDINANKEALDENLMELVNGGASQRPLVDEGSEKARIGDSAKEKGRESVRDFEMTDVPEREEEEERGMSNEDRGTALLAQLREQKKRVAHERGKNSEGGEDALESRPMAVDMADTESRKRKREGELENEESESIVFHDGERERIAQHFGIREDKTQSRRVAPDAVPINVDLSALSAHIKSLRAYAAPQEVGESASSHPTFVTSMTRSSVTEIERELSKSLTKEDFNNMDILGQFNLGFIITQWKNHLFVVDQHASDEKFNYEQLHAHTRLQVQRLLLPLQLDLSVADEMVVLDNLEIFRMNGFDFDIKEENPPTQRVKLTAYPFSKGAQFGVRDVQELIFLLKERGGASGVVRLARVNEVFASRACRKSVMIGTKLSHAKMKEIVAHMGVMANPWSCPHGRPTLRHLLDLSLLNNIKASALEKKKAKRIAKRVKREGEDAL